MFFGNSFLPRDNPSLRIIDGDIRDTAKFAAAVRDHDAVLNLACISNDASADAAKKSARESKYTYSFPCRY
jgi:nucleoside-diphosphate-sugar epimerase